MLRYKSLIIATLLTLTSTGLGAQVGGSGGGVITVPSPTGASNNWTQPQYFPKVCFGTQAAITGGIDVSGTAIRFTTDCGTTLIALNAVGYRISGAASTGTILRGDGTNFVGTTATFPNTVAAGNILVGSATNVISAVTPGSVNANPANQTGNATATLKMNGLGAAAAPCLITPAMSGRVGFNITGQITQTTTADGIAFKMVYGTGTPPANAAAASGTALNPTMTHTFLTGQLEQVFSVTGVATGLSLVATWFDLQVAEVTGGTASVTNVTCSAWEF